jgi:2-polyprenyl-3-methyl-5-hydroxy-6-metoxy-1,4-benzoquinol methylase
VALADSQPAIPCPHPEREAERLFPAVDYVTGDRFEIRRCGACGLALTWPQPSIERLSTYYPAPYYGSTQEGRFPRLVEAAQHRLFGWRARRVERLLGSKGRALDVGCGRGFLLSAFRRRGWSVEGTEISEPAARHAREVLGLTVHVGAIEELSLPSARFDAVSMWHVLEHVPEPSRVLAEVHRLLRPGGAFLVSVPNFDSPEARVTRAGWFHLDVPRHLVQFTPKTLRAELAAAGFEEVQASWFAPEYDAFSFAQSALNLIGFRHNLLYEILRGRGAKLLERDRAPAWQAALTVLAAAPLGVLGAVLTTATGFARRGSTLTVHARKLA